MTNNLFSIGIAIIFIGVFLIIISTLIQTKQSKMTTKVAVGGFIGPIPFGFSNDLFVNRFNDVCSSNLVYTENNRSFMIWS